MLTHVTAPFFKYLLLYPPPPFWPLDQIIHTPPLEKGGVSYAMDSWLKYISIISARSGQQFDDKNNYMEHFHD